jgi:hypothetical protein
VDGLGQELFGLGDEAGQGVQPDAGVAEPVGGAEPGELVDRVVEDLEAVVAGRGRGRLATAAPVNDAEPLEAAAVSRPRGWQRETRPLLQLRPSGQNR